MNPSLLLPHSRRVARSFGLAAAHYQQEAKAQFESAHRLLAGAAFAGRVLDIGCGTGWMCSELLAQPGIDAILALDIAGPMLSSPLLQHPRIQCIQADAAALPLASGCLDGVVSNFALQWLAAPEDFAAGLARVLRPGAECRLAMPVVGTLSELDTAWRRTEGRSPVNTFMTAEDWQRALTAAGIRITHAHQFPLFQYYPSVRALLRGLKAIGAAESVHKPAGLWGRRHLQALEAAMESFRTAQGLPLRYEVLHLKGYRS